MRRWLVLMARRPRAGAVKTRLAREIGVAEALRFYRATLARLVREVGDDPRWTTVLSVTPDIAVNDPVWRGAPARVPQGAGDLGARMQRVFDILPAGPAVIVGSDIPGVRAGHVADAFRSLGAADAVFGPAEDGGYWLVGLRRRPRVPRIFGGVRWSTRHVLADTLANCGGLDTATVATLSDVDTPADWRRWRRARG